MIDLKHYLVCKEIDKKIRQKEIMELIQCKDILPTDFIQYRKDLENLLVDYDYFIIKKFNELGKQK